VSERVEFLGRIIGTGKSPTSNIFLRNADTIKELCNFKLYVINACISPP